LSVSFQTIFLWYRNTLYRQLLISRISTLVLLLIILTFAAYTINLNAIRNEVNLRNEKLALSEAKTIHTEIDNIITNLHLFGYQIQSSNTPLDEQARVLLQFRQFYPLTYRAFYLFSPEGNLLLRLNAPHNEIVQPAETVETTKTDSAPLDESILLAFNSARRGTEFLSETTIGGIDQIPSLFYAFPVAPELNEKSRVLVAEIDLRDIWRKIDELTIGQTGRAFLFTRQGKIIAHPDRSYIGQQVEPELKQVLNGYEGTIEYFNRKNGNWQLAAFSPVGSATGWDIVVEQETGEIFASLYLLEYVSLIVLFLAIGCAAFITMLTTRKITKPVRNLVEASNRIIQTGNLDQEIPVAGEDEIAELARVYNSMVVYLREARRKLESYSFELENRVQERTRDLCKPRSY